MAVIIDDALSLSSGDVWWSVSIRHCTHVLVHMFVILSCALDLLVIGIWPMQVAWTDTSLVIF